MGVKKIAIVGRIRSGKNTVADYLTDNYGHKQYAFSMGILQVIKQYFPEALAEGKPRKHYQLIGQSFRELNPDIWIDITKRQLEVHKYLYRGQPAVITDLRQLNEYRAVKELGYTVIKVEAAEEIRMQRAAAAGDTFTPEQLNHETELQAEQCGYDYLIMNNTDLKDLYKQIDWLMAELKGEGE